MLFALLLSFANAMECEGVAPTQIRTLVRNAGPVNFAGVWRAPIGWRGCTGTRDTLAYYFEADRKSVVFFECRAGQAWMDPDDDVGGVSCRD